MSPKFRLLYSFPNRIGATGIGMTGWNQVTALSRLGVDITVYCGSCARPFHSSIKVVETMRIGGFPLPYRILGNLRSYERHDRITAAALRAAPHTVDVAHTWPLGALTTLQTARELGVPTVLERPNCHTAFAFAAMERECKMLDVRLERSNPHYAKAPVLDREAAEYDAADVLACPSDFVRKTFVDRGFDVRRLGRHRYGVDLDRFKAENGAVKKQCSTILFCGSGDPRKGLHYALKAWKESGVASTGRFVICGRISRDYRKALFRDGLLNDPSIKEVGFSNQVHQLMRDADVLVLPSVEEGSALVTYEARACGCVLLVSEATGAVCTHGHDALVHPAGDWKMLAEHMRLMTTDATLFQKLRLASIASASELGWDRAASALIDVYEQAISQRSQEALHARFPQ